MDSRGGTLKDVSLSQDDLQKAEEFRRSKDTSVLVIMFADMEGSTALRENMGDVRFEVIRKRVKQVLVDTVTGDDAGIVLKDTGDGVLAVFAEPSSAVERALAIQDQLHRDPYIEVRIGMDMGQVAVEREGGITTDAFGRYVNRAARVTSLADGGHILMTATVWDSAEGWLRAGSHAHRAHGPHKVRDVPQALDIHEIYNANVTASMDRLSAPKTTSEGILRRLWIDYGWGLAAVAGILIVLLVGIVWRNRVVRGLPTPPPPAGVQEQVWGLDDSVMVYVPAGEFRMGSTDGDADEQPLHTVHLDAFWIDKYEVTNAQYRKCVAVGVCRPPSDYTSNSRDAYYDDPQYDNYPVVYVSWHDARTYCQWAGKRLPSEAEWEKAARGTTAQQYPWGDHDPKADELNFCDRNCPFDEWRDNAVDDGFADTAPVGSFPAGRSPYGALDMAGNVAEWTGSLYMNYPYDASDGREDPNSEAARVSRGGTWGDEAWDGRAASRSGDPPDFSDDDIGFRCALSTAATPANTSMSPLR